MARLICIACSEVEQGRKDGALRRATRRRTTRQGPVGDGIPGAWLFEEMTTMSEHDEQPALSRRAVLRAAVVWTGTVLAATMVPDRTTLAQSKKVSKEAMKYQDKPNGDKQCSNCQHFQPPASCEIVEGTVSPQGYCLSWVKKA
jgi:hypothetical protein